MISEAGRAGSDMAGGGGSDASASVGRWLRPSRKPTVRTLTNVNNWVYSLDSQSSVKSEILVAISRACQLIDTL